MMKKIFTLIVSTLVSTIFMVASAEFISQDVAKLTADNFLSLDDSWQGATDATITMVEHDGVPAYYVVEYTTGGWAIVSAQSSSTPVIGYNTTGKFVAPAPVQELLDFNAKMTAARVKDGVEMKHQGWERVMQRKPAADVNTTPDIKPLITINLNQSNPYNKYCPSINGQHALVGCVAVGMTQAMMVQRFPARPVGSNSYTPEGLGKLSIDFDAEPAYDWDAILSCDETKNYDEVARMLYHAGMSIDMMYSLQFSGAYMDDAARALVKNFQYDQEKIGLYFRYQYSDAEWYDIILTDLLMGRAVLYQAAADEAGNGGHCWNIDGWQKSTQMVHCNWGWGGYGDGYFNLDNMTDSYQGISFLYHHGAITGVGVPTTAPYGIELSRNKFTAGTAAGVALADVTVFCEDEEATIVYELKGPKNIAGKHVASPYEVVDGKLVSTKTVEDAAAFRELYMTVTNDRTGESFSREFKFQIVSDNAVESVMSDAMRVYPSVAHDYITVEVPASGGEYAIYSIAGTQAQAGQLTGHKTEVNVSSLVAGTYILRYVHAEGVGVKTFIVR